MGGHWEYGWGWQDDTESVVAIPHALAAGIDPIDAAPADGPGHSEEVVGRRPRGRIRRECEDSLRPPGVEVIDLCRFQWPDTRTGTPVEVSWGTVADLVRVGNGALGGRVIVYSPMVSGLLTGTDTRERHEALDPGDWPAGPPASRPFGDPALGRKPPPAGRAAAGRRAPRPHRRGGAMARTLARPEVTGAIRGARRPDQVDGWPAGGELAPGDDDLEEIAAAIALTGAGRGPVRPA